MSEACPVCRSALDPREGRGRPAAYCSHTCRRTAEFTIRRLARRIDAGELELREVERGFDRWGRAYHDEDDRRARVRALRSWVKKDTQKLRELLGQPTKNTSKTAAI